MIIATTTATAIHLDLGDLAGAFGNVRKTYIRKDAVMSINLVGSGSNERIRFRYHSGDSDEVHYSMFATVNGSPVSSNEELFTILTTEA